LPVTATHGLAGVVDGTTRAVVTDDGRDLVADVVGESPAAVAVPSVGDDVVVRRAGGGAVVEVVGSGPSS
jgi:hypothetical protein